MRKTLLLLAVILCTLSASAQKRLKSLSAPVTLSMYGQSFTIDLVGDFSYNDKGDISRFALSFGVDGQNEEFLATEYTYTDERISQAIKSADTPVMDISVPLIGGKANSITYTADGVSSSFNFSYAGNGKLRSVDGTDEEKQDIYADLAWDGDNLKSSTIYDTADSVLSKTIYSYSNVKAVPALQAMVSYFIESELSEDWLCGLTPAKYFGLTTANLPSQVIFNAREFADSDDTSAAKPKFADADADSDEVENDTISFDYKVDASGLPTTINITGLNLELDESMPAITNLNFTLTYENDPTATGIAAISTTRNAEPAQIFTLDGRQIDKPVHGINIMKYSDGTTRKVVMK